MVSKYKPKLTKEQREEIVKLYNDENSNYTLHQLGEMFGCSYVAIYKTVQKYKEQMQ